MEDLQPRLLLTEVDGVHTYLLTRTPFTIGRSSDCDLCIPNAQVSRQHAVIERDDDGGLSLRDLGSRHGTWRNAQRVERARLCSGDRITLGTGPVGLTYLDEAAPDQERLSHAISESGRRDTARDLLTRVSSHGAGTDLEKLSLFLEAAQRFSGSAVLDDVLDTTIEYTLRLTCAERGFIFLGDDFGSLRLRIGRSSDGSVLQDDSTISKSIVRDAADSGLDYILGDATASGAALGRDSIIVHDLRSVIAIPLRRRGSGRLLGLLYLDSRLQSCNLSTVSREILGALAVETATLVENARMLEAEQAAALMRKEMEIAALIQQRIIASELPRIPDYTLRARTLPCTEVGGDFYDVIPTADGFVAIVADVSGKGMSAALLASIVQGMMYAQISAGFPLVAAIHSVNDFLCARVSGEKYLTMVAVRCRHDGSAELVNGGHVQPILVQPDGTRRVLVEGDMPIGMMASARFHAIPLHFDEGSRLILLSDGVSESENQIGQQFTLEHFSHCLGDVEPIEAMFKAVDHFTAGRPPADDQTMLTIDRRTAH